MQKSYVIDDNFRISKEIENLSEEELDRRIAVLEKAAIEKGKDIPVPTLLIV